MQIATVDFETEGIEDRPNYPPNPVGVAIRIGNTNKYYAWSHPSENNFSRSAAILILRNVYATHEILYHHAAFDIEVGQVHLKLPAPRRFHDTLFLAYLYDPRAKSLGLKPLANSVLGMPPTEQDELREWILEHVEAATEKTWGAYIALAPGKLVGKYAKGDTLRTYKLFRYFWRHIKATGQMEAYERELALVKIKLSMENHGIKTNRNKIKRDLKKFTTCHATLEKRIKHRLGIRKRDEANYPNGAFNLGSPQQLVAALKKTGKVKAFRQTAKGNPSTSIENLRRTCSDKKLVMDLGMHSTLSTYLSTFLLPWLSKSADTNGYLYPNFNTTRSTDEYGGKGGFGTKTGRPSSSNPNFNNIPADIVGSKNELVLLALAKELKKYRLNFVGLRDYIMPDEGCLFLGRDYNQQELRVLAHYEDGELLQLYLDDPDLDIHEYGRLQIRDESGLDLPRKKVKIVGFSIIYGTGIPHLMDGLDCTRDEAKEIKAAYYRALPGIKELDKALKKCAKTNTPIETWGGRQYYCEEPKFVGKRFMEFGYKLLNLLIQGSSADITKQAMIQVHEAIHGHIKLQVYDELLVSTEIGREEKDMRLMKEAMEDIELDLPLPTDGEWSKVSWGRMKHWRDA